MPGRYVRRMARSSLKRSRRKPKSPRPHATFGSMLQKVRSILSSYGIKLPKRRRRLNSSRLRGGKKRILARVKRKRRG